MLKKLDIAIIALMAAAAVLTFRVKYQADQQLAEVRSLEAQIRLEEDTIDLLNADWSLVVQPGRLQKLVETHQEELGLDVTKPEQIVRPQELPAFVIDLPEPEPDEERMADSLDSTNVTGSVDQ